MAAASGSEDVQADLEEKRQWLARVEEALKLDPDRKEALELRTNLLELISVLEGLLVPAGDNETAHEGLEEGGDHVVHANTAPTAAAQQNALIGRTCVFEARGNKVYGRIAKLKKDGKVDRIIVQVIGVPPDESSSSGNTNKVMEVDLRAVRLLVAPSVDLLVKGARGQAIWTEDGIWYQCVIVDTFDTGRGQLRSRVRFTEYGNEDVVPIDRIRLDGATHTGQKRKVKEIITPGGYKIPEAIQIKPTDSEHQKQLKKKKIALCKKQQRQDTVETEAKQRASAWQQHFSGSAAPSKKGAPRPRAGSRATVPTLGNAPSIFSTSDLPEGKVGVTNSGRGMTTFRTRQKHVYEVTEDGVEGEVNNEVEGGDDNGDEDEGDEDEE